MTKRNGKRNENPDGKKSGHLQVFFWWKLSRWKKKPGRSKVFFPLQKEMFSFQKEMEKEMKILLGKKSGHLQVFSLVEIIQVEKKPVLVEKNSLMKA